MAKGSASSQHVRALVSALIPSRSQRRSMLSTSSTGTKKRRRRGTSIARRSCRTLPGYWVGQTAGGPSRRGRQTRCHSRARSERPSSDRDAAPLPVNCMPFPVFWRRRRVPPFLRPTIIRPESKARRFQLRHSRPTPARGRIRRPQQRRGVAILGPEAPICSGLRALYKFG